MTLAKQFGISPFEILNTDIDDFILLVNFYLEKGEAGEKEPQPQKSNTATEKRVRVNDDTASGGWF